MVKIGVLGAGSWGLGLAMLLHNNGHDVTVWSIDEKEIEMLNTYREQKDRLPGVHLNDTIVFTTDLEQTIDGKKMIICAVPSPFIRNQKIAEYSQDIDAQKSLVEKYQKEMDAADAQIAEIQRKLAEQQAAQQQSSGGSGSTTPQYYTPSGGSFMWPATQGSRISSYFGPRTSPTAGASSNHKGIDIPCPTGSDVVASAAGTVVISQYSSSAGYYIMIDHGNGISTVYMHNSQLVVGVGQTVEQGQVIAKAGSTGYSTGSHCHFGVMVNGTYVNPLDYL